MYGFDPVTRYDRRHPPGRWPGRRQRFVRMGALVGVLLLTLAIAGMFVAAGAQAAPPLTGSQVITLEHGPDGVWLNQAWLVEWQARPDTRLALVYDTLRHDPGTGDLALAYRQWDASVTYAPATYRWLPWIITLGRRWQTEVSGRALDGAGPWHYAMLTLGW